MSRWLAGVLDPSGRKDVAIGTLFGEASRTLKMGPLRLAYTGPPLPDSSLVSLFDGHLDNASDLARDLGEDGHSTLDIERLLAAGFRRWGVGLPGRMRGDFILLVWDREREEGILARDQLGMRPFFLRREDGAIRFASDIALLLATMSHRPSPDRASVAHWLGMSNRPGPHTLFEGVGRLAAGTLLRLSRDGFGKYRYWEPSFDEPLELAPEQLAGRVRGALGRAVERRIDRTGGTGVLMSGGLDSSSVAALCAERARERTLVCSATFPEHAETDESELIDELREALDLPAIVAAVRSGGVVASAIEHLAAWQVPLASWGDSWALELMRAAKAEGVGTMLAGDGGDELFAPRSYLLADRLLAGHPRGAFDLLGQLPGAGPWVPRRERMRIAATLGLAGALPFRLERALRAPFATRGSPPWFRRQTARELADSDDPIAWKRLDGPRWWTYAAHGVAYGIEEAGVFDHQRRRAAMVGLEAREPMLDLELVELALRQPPVATLDTRFNRPVLRNAMEGLLPDSVRLRPHKAWFESLVVDSLCGPDWEAVRFLLADPAAEVGAYVDLSVVRRSLLDSDHLRQEAPFRWMAQVWRLLTAEMWLRAQAHEGTFVSSMPAPSSPRVGRLYLRSGRSSEHKAYG